MKIRSNNKKFLINNNPNLYNNLYQKIKEEIKNIVITKLLNQIQELYKKYEKLKKENSIIKNDLIYILKRVLLNKNDFIKVNNTNNISCLNKSTPGKSIYSINGLKNNSYLNSKSYNSFYTTDKLNNENSNFIQLYHNYYNRNNNSIGKSSIEKRRYSIDDDYKKVNVSSSSHLESSLQFNMQNKIDYYLNSLYKHNFSEECATGTSSVHLLNKNLSIYDELFSNKNNKSKNFSHLNTDYNFRKISNQKDRKNIYINDDKNENNISNRKNNRSNSNIYKNKSNNYLKVHRKGNIINLKPKISDYNRKNKSISSNNMANNNYKKAKYVSSHLNNRSRYLVNKF